MNWEAWAKLILSLVALDLLVIKFAWWFRKKLERKEGK